MDLGAIRNFSDMVIRVSADGVITDATPSVESVLGYPPERLMGRSLPELLSADTSGPVAESIAESIEAFRHHPGTAQFVHFRALSEFGAWLHFDAVLRPEGPDLLRIDCHDVTEQRKLVEMWSLRDRALTATSNAFVISDASLPDMPIIYVNPAFERISGYPPAEVIGKNCRFLQGRDHDQPGVVEMRKAIRAQRPCRVILRNYQKDGTLFWNDLSLSPIFDNGGKLTHYLGVQSEISQSKLLEEQLSHSTFHDGLTDLPNRLLFMQKLDQAGRSSTRGPNCTFAVMLLDIAKFKIVNDTLGPSAGDKLLKYLADSLLRCMRDIDTVARLGGDEFVVLAEDITGPEQAMQIGDRIRSALSGLVVIEGQEINVTIGLGIALGGKADAVKPLDCLRNADIAHKRAKQAGNVQCVLFDDVVAVNSENRLQLENEIRSGIENGEFLPYYQPIVDLGSGRISRFEALVRWKHPTRGLLAPFAFLALAEESDLIVKLGHSILNQVAGDLAAWMVYMENPLDLSVNFNLSGREFSQVNLIDWIADVLNRHDLLPSCLHLEITEGVVMDLPETSRLKLRQLRDLGFLVHIDDFGTGHSSLSRLQHFPLDCLKIDKSFVDNIEKDRTSAEIVRSITAMAHTLGLTVVAEGVETEGQADILRQFGCEYGQGYYFARPLPAAAVIEILKRESLQGTSDKALAIPVTALVPVS